MIATLSKLYLTIPTINATTLIYKITIFVKILKSINKLSLFTKALLLCFICVALCSCKKQAEETFTAGKISAKMDAPSSRLMSGEQVFLVPNVRQESNNYKESSHTFVTPTGWIMTGRRHSGDENGSTIYEYADLKAVDSQGQPLGGIITVEDGRWEGYVKESNSVFVAPSDRVVLGREHYGDENKNTRYFTGVVKYNGVATAIINYVNSITTKESNGTWFRSGSDQVVVGRTHTGDENGNTFYKYATIVFNTTVRPPSRFKVVVRLHPTEPNYPMNPIDFITASRFREHVEGGSDKGFNKNLNRFETTNSHNPEFYNIPVNIINSYVGPFPNSLNLRPHDEHAYRPGQVFLEPDDNLVGDISPNGRVPVFQYTVGSQIQYWMFYGYNFSEILLGALSFSHQGDWENVILNIKDNKIESAILSQHDSGGAFIQKENLIITESDGVQTLYIYSARGSHALYEKAGDFHTANTDHARDNGYQWVITDNVQDLSTQPWKDYSGAWGEVGENTHTTGPLGPWYKRLGFQYF
ncbi:hypothetical protein PBAL39_23752 [Pedobacter sp. BAL39]|uniref:Vps62-related protein n=1 Tax=Pedobacter sp. BAL39 TaxID=391596 RepID=UPI0001559537|nr:Vps62-related protein [Pedobacter sp. BAL39]EDM36076.1 hypothetical protein PBAL39_23752 [Pedobacter sp. BAL39]